MDLLTWSKFNCYTFYESEHKYYWYDKPVKTSVTQFISTLFEPFDSDAISLKYAQKHGLKQEDVLFEWDKKSKISSTTGTIIHKYLEDYARGKVFDIDYSLAEKYNILDEVKERVSQILPQAKRFHDETLNKLIPIQCEYTVGIDDIIAGNIDLLCWNMKAGEFQIWDYKNLKEMTTYSKYRKYGLKEFSNVPDCHLTHYSIQQNLYKIMLERKLGIKIGNCYLVHFSHLNDDFDVYECMDLTQQCNKALDRLIEESKDGTNNKDC